MRRREGEREVRRKGGGEEGRERMGRGRENEGGKDSQFKRGEGVRWTMCMRASEMPPYHLAVF